MNLFDFHDLEKRLLFAATPATPRADSLGKAFDGGERQILFDRLGNLDATTKSTLQTKLNTSAGQFDSALLSYMRTRSDPNFFFDPSHINDVGSFVVNNNLDYADVQTHSDAITNHLFPEQGSSGDFTVQLGANVNWVAPGGSTNPEFVHEMNRMEWLREMAWQNGISRGDAKYAAEVEYELASWSQQFPTVGVPATFSASDQQGWLLDSSLRAESWTWAYFGYRDHPNFTGAEDSLFLYKFVQTGDFLYDNALSTTDYGSNKTIVLGKALLYLGEMFPEIDKAAKWETTARNLLFKCLDAQIYNDGSHVEQSPGYTFNVSNDLLDARQLDKVNGIAWPKDKRTKLANSVDSYWQELSPNGKRPAIGDSYRNNSLALFTKPDLILETDRWPVAKPAARDVFIAGTAAVTPFLNAPTKPDSLGARGKTFAMTDSGNYVFRSGDDKNATQINFDAGPKKAHGHFDLLSFELSGGGRPLISDPGAFKYDKSADRKYVVSTQAHNTINADGQNTAAIEGATNSDIIVSQYRTGTNFAQVTASHKGYKALAGGPLITRSMWYDLDGTILIVDWAQGSAKHNYQQSFNLQTEGDTKNIIFAEDELSARTKYSSGGNVRITGVRVDDGETASRGNLTFVTNTVSGDYKDDAYRFTLNQSGKFVVMVTMIQAYNGLTPPNVTASLLNTPVEGGTIKIELNKNGVKQQVDFSPPPIYSLDAAATSRGTYNDIAYDSSNRLHMAWADRDTGALLYAVRSAAGKWSAPTIIDAAANPDINGGYQFVSLSLNKSGVPSVAYFDGWNGDLKFASQDASTGKFSAKTLDSKGSTGLYPSLAFGVSNEAVITYYDRTDKDLLMATSGTGGKFSIKPIDTAGDVGRFSSLQLDPNRSKTVSNWAIGYEDTSGGNYKYALQGDFDGGTKANGYTNYLVDDLPDAGGYVSLAFYDSGAAGTKKFKPAMSYYDASESALKFAKSTDGTATWATEFVATKSVQGLYTNLIFDSAGKANIFYFDRTNNEARRAVLGAGGWALSDLRAGGREIHVSLDSAGKIAYSTLNEANAQLNVYVI